MRRRRRIRRRRRRRIENTLAVLLTSCVFFDMSS